MILAGTGHRPPKFGGFGSYEMGLLFTFLAEWIQPRKDSIEEIITGMALGFDQRLARAAILHGIPFTAAIPFKDQDLMWPEHAKSEYRLILSSAAKTIIVSEGGYHPSKMQVRNEWMVDNCDKLISMWDGSSGGTANCIKYADGVKPIIPLWDEWVKYKEKKIDNL